MASHIEFEFVYQVFERKGESGEVVTRVGNHPFLAIFDKVGIRDISQVRVEVNEPLY